MTQPPALTPISGDDLAERVLASSSGPRVFGGFRVLGPVDLSGRVLASAVRFEGCVFDAGINLDEANARSISVVGGELPWFTAQGTEVNGLLSFRGVQVGEVTLRHGRIARDLVLGADDDSAPTICDAIDATALRVDGTMRAARLECRRGLRLDRAQVVGGVELLGAQLGPDEDGTALRADDAGFGEFVARPDAAGRPFTTEGVVRLLRTAIDGACDLRGAQLDADGEGANVVLTGDGMRCDELTCDGVLSPGGWTPFRAGGGIHLFHATVRGRLGLRGAELRGGPFGVALFANGAAFGWVRMTPADGHATTVSGTIELSGCRIAGNLFLDELELDAGDYGPFVDVGHGRIDGTLSLAGARLTGNDVGVPRIALDAGGLTARGVTARPERRQQPLHVGGAVVLRQAQVTDAVDLADALISVFPEQIAIQADELQAREFLLPAASVVGTVRLIRAQVERRCDLRGARIEVEPRNAALDASNGRFGFVDLGAEDGEPFRASGAVRLAGAEIAEGLYLGSAQVRVGVEATSVAVNLQRMRSPMVRFSTADEQTWIDGGIDAQGAVIDAELDLRGARVRAVDRPAVNLTVATIGTVLAVPDDHGRRFDCDGRLFCAGAQIAQALDLSGARIAVAEGYALEAAEATIGRVRLAIEAGQRFEAVGGVSLRAAVVGQTVHAEGALLVASGSDDDPDDYAFFGERLRVSDLSLVAGEDVYGPPFVARGGVVLVSAEIAGTLRLDGALITARRGQAAVTADGATVGGIRASDGESRTLTARGQLRMPAVRVEHDIELAGAVVRVERFVERGDPASRPRDDALLLVGATVVGDLIIDGATLTSETGAALRADRATLGSISGGRNADGEPLRATGSGAGLDLADVRIHGGMLLDHAKVEASHGPAVVVRNAAVGSVELDGARLRGGGQTVVAVRGDRLLTSRVVANGGLRATGTIDFREAKIEDRLELYGATVDGSASTRRISINLSRAHCPTVNLGSAPAGRRGHPAARTTITGELLVIDAAIPGSLNLMGVVLEGTPDGDGMVLDRATIGTVRLGADRDGQPSELRGRNLLRGTTIAGQLDVTDVVLALADPEPGDAAPDEHPVAKEVVEVLDASAATIGELWFAPQRATGRVVLLGTRTPRLVTAGRMDDSAPGLDLAGLHYDRWDAISDDGLARDWRLSVVRDLTDPGVPHDGDPPGHLRSLEPFERLAGTTRAEGDEQFARRVLGERERFVTQQRVVRDREQAFPRRWAYRAWRATYRLAVGYGYREWQAVVGLLVLIAIALGLTSIAADHGHVELRAAVPDGTAAAVAAPPTSRTTTTSATTASAPTGVTTTTPTPPAGRSPSSGGGTAPTRGQDEFDQVIYALERVLPAVDLGERSRIRVTGPLGWMLGVCSLLGWILVIALIAAVTKTLRRD